jgi:transcriptional regulator NrdR family protein
MVKCPRCGYERTRVTGGEQRPTGYARRRMCPKCYKKFETIEEMTGLYSPKEKLKKAVRRNVAANTDNSPKVGIC